MDFKYKRNYKAEDGENGKTKTIWEKGSDLILKVPLGTIVKDGDSGKVIVDLKEEGQTFVIAKGGKGGKGNAKFATPTRQALDSLKQVKKEKKSS